MRVGASIRLLSFVFLVSNLGGCEGKPNVTRDRVQEAWDNYNNPAQLDAGSVVTFNELPAAGESIRIPWSDIYWPSRLGGISLRWRDGNRPPFDLPRLTEADVRKMSVEQIAGLSPAEKYDIFMGRFDFPTVQAELMRTHPAMPGWFGLCHGWASAAVNFDEPGAVTLKGASGIDVSFGSGDIKALLAYAQGVVYMPAARSLGQRCEVDFTTRPELRNSAACRDTNAGSFHLILTNLVGRQGQTVIADLSRDAEVWNFPIYGFSTREISRRPASPGAAPQAVSEVVVETEVSFLMELDAPNWQPVGDSRAVAGQKIVYQYAVELDSLGRVVGGQWISDERPDFMWVQEKADFRGYYGAVESIYSASRNTSGPVVGSPIVVPTPSASPLPAPTPYVPPTPPPAPSPVAAPEPPQAPSAPQAPAAPTTPPTADPSQPIGPILTQPLPLPGANQPGDTNYPHPVPPVGPTLPPSVALSCPPGSSPFYSPVPYCTDGNKAFAPYTRAMFETCLRNSMSGCNETLWKNDLYLSLRGTDVCPMGAVWDAEVNSCVEGSNTVLGPFAPSFIDKCLATGFGNLCFSLKMDLVYFSLVNIAR